MKEKKDNTKGFSVVTNQIIYFLILRQLQKIVQFQSEFFKSAHIISYLLVFIYKDRELQ